MCFRASPPGASRSPPRCSSRRGGRLCVRRRSRLLPRPGLHRPGSPGSHAEHSGERRARVLLLGRAMGSRKDRRKKPQLGIRRRAADIRPSSNGLIEQRLSPEASLSRSEILSTGQFSSSRPAPAWAALSERRQPGHGRPAGHGRLHTSRPPPFPTSRSRLPSESRLRRAMSAGLSASIGRAIVPPEERLRLPASWLRQARGLIAS